MGELNFNREGRWGKKKRGPLLSPVENAILILLFLPQERDPESGTSWIPKPASEMH